MQRHAIIVPASIVDNCNQVAETLGIDPGGKLNTLSVPLVPTEGEEDATATHYAACGRINEAQRLTLEAGFQGGAFSGAMWWRWDDQGEPILRASYDAEHLGESWSWEKSLEAANLKLQILHS